MPNATMKPLLDKADRYDMTEEERAEYESLLNVSGNGIIGYIEIPMIQCSLPIYHGTEESVLQIAVGHIEGSSLPTGGAGTHCVLSGHRGLAQRQAVHRFGPAGRGGYLHSADSGRDLDLRGGSNPHRRAI